MPAKCNGISTVHMLAQHEYERGRVRRGAGVGGRACPWHARYRGEHVVLGFVVLGFEDVDRRVRFPPLANPAWWGKDHVRRGSVWTARNRSNSQSNGPMPTTLSAVGARHNPWPAMPSLMHQQCTAAGTVEFNPSNHPSINMCTFNLNRHAGKYNRVCLLHTSSYLQQPHLHCSC